jgi:hypothetical protein
MAQTQDLREDAAPAPAEHFRIGRIGKIECEEGATARQCAGTQEVYGTGVRGPYCTPGRPSNAMRCPGS